jgi:hypothetical protein
VPTNEPTSLARRFLGFCASVLIGIVLLSLAIQLLSQFWGWLVLLAFIAGCIYLMVVAVRWRRNRW